MSLEEAKEPLDELPGERVFGLDRGKFVVPEDFDAPMTLIDDLPSDPSLEKKIRREAVLALCRLADSLPVLDPRSSEEILSDDDLASGYPGFRWSPERE